MQLIEEVADEGSSFFPRIDFLDEDGAPVTVDTCFWKLTDMQGNVINERDAVEITPINTTYVVIPLGGSDLEVMGDAVASRLLTVYGTYTSSTYGANKPYRHQIKFNIQPEIGG
jgi:hypothetical protein